MKGMTLKQASIPASAATLSKAATRNHDEDLSRRAVEQTLNCEAPPAPDQSRMLPMDKIVNDAEVMSDMLTHSLKSSLHDCSPTGSVILSSRGVQKIPPQRGMTYPVLVPVSSRTDATRSRKTATRLGGNLDASALLEPRTPGSTAKMVMTDHGAFPMRDVKIARLGISLISATGLRAADRSGLSDPYCVVRIPGRPKSKYATRVIKATVNPVWRESCEIEEFFAGDELEFSIFDKDISGCQLLGRACLTQAMLLPDGVAGELDLYDDQRPEEGPILRTKVMILENFDPDGVLQAKAVRGAEDSDEEAPPAGEACRDLDHFEASLRPVPRLGNFWMTPRGDMKTASHDGGAQRG